MSSSIASKKNAFYAQSGGVTAVINTSACGVIEAAREHSDKIGHVYAGHNGIIGALREDLLHCAIPHQVPLVLAVTN